MELYFISISMTGLTPSECHDVHRKVVSLIHDHNTINRSDRVAIAYPDYRLGIPTDTTLAQDYGEEQRLVRRRKGFLGRGIRLFGSIGVLRPLFGTVYATLGDISGLSMVTPTVVPVVAQYANYIAHKGMTNMTPSRLRRQSIRRRGDTDPTSLTPDQLERRYVECQKTARATHLPNVGVQSRTNGQLFSIFIEQTVADGLNFIPNGYGFSTPTQMCSIPIF